MIFLSGFKPTSSRLPKISSFDASLHIACHSAFDTVRLVWLNLKYEMFDHRWRLLAVDRQTKQTSKQCEKSDNWGVTKLRSGVPLKSKRMRTFSCKGNSTKYLKTKRKVLPCSFALIRSAVVLTCWATNTSKMNSTLHPSSVRIFS